MEVLSYDDCSIIMNKYTNNKVKLINYNLRRISDSILGFLGDHLWLEATVLKSGNLENIKLFVKAMPQIAEIAQFLKESKLFKKEEMLLQKLFPKLLEYSSIPWTAKCYLSRHLIVLEDLTLKQYSNLEVIDTFDYPHAEAIMKTLARFHSSSIIYEQIHGKNKIYDDYKDMLYETRFVLDKTNPRHKNLLVSQKSIFDLLKAMPNYKSEYGNKFLKFLEHVYDLLGPSDKYANVVTHGDIWSNNVMFKTEKDGSITCKIIDFQITRYTVPVSDIIIFIYSSTTADFREKHLDDLLSVYRSTMKQELARYDLDVDDIFTVQELNETWHLYKPLYLLDCAIIRPIFNLSQEMKKSIFENENGFMQFMLEDKSDFLLEAFRTDSRYRANVSDVMNEIINSCILV